MAASLNIAALAARTGVRPDTLRKWEERYGVLRPERTEGGQRRYSVLDVERVEWLKARLAEGYRIGDAAALLVPEGGAPRSPRALRDALYRAAVDADAVTLERLLDQTLTIHPLQQAATEVLAPLLRRIGEGWASGELSVAQEHLVSAAVRARLDRVLADARGDVRGIAVLACAPGEQHELGLLMLGTLLRADGWQIAYLGADTPFAEAISLAERLRANALVVSVTMHERIGKLRTELDRASRAGIPTVIGGVAASKELAESLGALYAGPKLERAVTTMRTIGA